MTRLESRRRRAARAPVRQPRPAPDARTPAVPSPAPVEQTIQRLAVIETDDPVVVTCYLPLPLELRQRRLERTSLSQPIRELDQQLAALRLDRRALAEIRTSLDRIREWASRPANFPALPGVALFCCERLGLFEVVPLPRVQRARLAVDHHPLLHELLDARERLDHYLAVVIDGRHARLFDIGPDATVELLCVITSDRHGGRFHGDAEDAPGWNEKHYHNRITSQRHRHYAEVARQASRLVRTRALAGVAVLGPSVHAQALVDFMPDELRTRLLGTARGNARDAGPADVSRATWLLQATRERLDEATLVDQIERGLAGGRTVTGTPETLRALARGQVRTLVVPAGANGSGYRCTRTGRLVLTAAQCVGEGAPMPVRNLIDAAIDDALRQRADVRVIDDAELAKRIEGLAATLRFTI